MYSCLELAQLKLLTLPLKQRTAQSNVILPDAAQKLGKLKGKLKGIDNPGALFMDLLFQGDQGIDDAR